MLTSDLISHVERRLYSGHRPIRNELSSAYTSGGTSLVFTYDIDGIAKGSYIAVDLEIFYVWDADAATKTATVQGAQLGSTAADHDDGAIAHINPLYTKFDILQSLNDDIESLSGEGLFQMKTVDITYSASAAGFDLTGVTDLLEVYDVVHKSLGLTKDWNRAVWRFRRNQLTSDFASGLSIEFPEGAYPGQTVRVLYKAPFTTLSALTDNVETVTGLSTAQTKIPVLGAAAQIMGSREAKRTVIESQGDARRADEVPVGSQGRVMRDLLALRREWVNAAVTELTKKYPPRLT